MLKKILIDNSFMTQGTHSIQYFKVNLVKFLFYSWSCCCVSNILTASPHTRVFTYALVRKILPFALVAVKFDEEFKSELEIHILKTRYANLEFLKQNDPN